MASPRRIVDVIRHFGLPLSTEGSCHGNTKLRLLLGCISVPSRRIVGTLKQPSWQLRPVCILLFSAICCNSRQFKMELTKIVCADSQHQRSRPTFCNLSGLLDEKLSDVTVTVHGHYSDEAAKSYRLHGVILSGK